ncbi:MAG TPA: transposase [Terriglobia bacterium]|nr:transposase [Terriglobia bacterium]
MGLRLVDLKDLPPARILTCMSRLRRPFLSERFFFLTVKLLPSCKNLADGDFACLARCLDAVRCRQRFLVTAWVFLPDHWHAILFPPYPRTISQAMKSVKLASTNALGRLRGEAGELWQPRFFDHALRTVQDYWEKVEYIHLNPVRRGLVARPEDWTWSSAAEYLEPPRKSRDAAAAW